MATQDLQRLATLVTRRRLQLNLSMVRAASATGMSRDTWSRVENGQPIRLMNYDKIEDILQWATGSCQKILDGGDPVETDSSLGEAPVEYAAVPPEAMEKEIRLAVQNAMVAGTDLTADKIREVNEKAIALLRERGMLPDVG